MRATHRQLMLFRSPSHDLPPTHMDILRHILTFIRIHATNVHSICRNSMHSTLMSSSLLRSYVMLAYIQYYSIRRFLVHSTAPLPPFSTFFCSTLGQNYYPARKLHYHYLFIFISYFK